jgi:hypothetical protein
MIYICADTQGKVPQSSVFEQKGLSGMTQGRLSDIVLLAKPHCNQVAFSGYKDNIEAFLCATARKMKVSISAGHFPIPLDYNPTVPLPLPRIVFKLAKKGTPAGVEKMEKALEKYGLAKRFVGKGDPCYTIDRPDVNFIRNTLPAISLPRGPTIEGYAQADAAVSSLRVYQCIDLFLRTNTYYYREGIEREETIQADTGGLQDIAEVRIGSGYYRPGFSSKSAIKKVRTQELADLEPRRVDSRELEDMTPHMDTVAPIGSAVLVAKPSFLPATTSYGTLRDVPNHPGLLFPYFQGMLAGDTAAVRKYVGDHLFRNLGSGDVTSRDAFRNFRSEVGTFANTSEGVLIAHVLCGLSLALNTQSHLYLLFEDGGYKGFCLLGKSFSVFIHGKWQDAIPAEELRAELDRIRTRKVILEDLAAALGRCETISGDVLMVEDGDINSPRKLAPYLSRVKEEHEENREVIEEVRAHLGQLAINEPFLTFRPGNITWAVERLTTKSAEPIEDTKPLYIPLKGWSKLGTREYMVFASFGPRSFSFRNATGTEIRISKKAEADPFKERGEDGNLKFQKFIVGEKPIQQCISEWKVLEQKRSLKMDFVERAAGSRNHVFRGRDFEEFWGVLKEAAEAGQFDKDAEVPVESAKRKYEIAFKGDADLDALF